jgi:hypothetical protein
MMPYPQCALKLNTSRRHRNVFVFIARQICGI